MQDERGRVMSVVWNGDEWVGRLEFNAEELRALAIKMGPRGHLRDRVFALAFEIDEANGDDE